MSYISDTPKPPYYAVVFTSINADTDHAEHNTLSERMLELAQGYDGFLGIEPARNTDGTGVAVSYWRDLETIQKWAMDPEHRIAKEKGRTLWYDLYRIRIAKVERENGHSIG
ncbi:MAG: antibiotic biosynthesis monooxygenase [Rhodospirillaceae bacterium]|nr:antibiotic biosynthesis monooxygenase [Rhodospirillaceae bacterium]MDD9927949.1 antibiotic biosynthesis monooxygenase [Rhodospirillaceae bacterium]